MASILFILKLFLDGVQLVKAFWITFGF